jgi:hypothetical protein
MSRAQKWVGQALERTEDRRLLTKGGHFIDDLTLPGVAHAAYVRSPHARAKIRRIDVRRALEHPGVYAAITGDDVAQLTRPQRGRVPLPNSPKVYALAYQQVRYVGEPVVGIAALDRATAEDAAEFVEVEYDPLPPVIDAEEALKSDAPLVFEEVGSNILWHDTFPYGDVEGAFKEADTVVAERVTIHRYCSTPLETFGVMAQYEAATESYTIWGHTQQPAQDLHVLAAALGVSPGKIRMIVPPMGGSFGNKVRPLFLIAAALLARKAGRPVKWIEDRRESLLALGHAADGIMEMSAAVKADGTVLAIKFRNIENEGAGIDFAARHNLLMLSNIANCYRFRALSYEGYSVVTNRCPVVANRGIGKPFMCFAVERMIDAVARALKIDRAEIRFRNFIQPDQFPYDTPSGQIVRGKLYRHFVARQDSNKILSHFAGDVCQHHVFVVQLNFEHSVGQRLKHHRRDLNCIFLRHPSPRPYLSNPKRKLIIIKETHCQIKCIRAKPTSSSASTSNSPSTRTKEPVVMAHDELCFNLLNSIHGNTHHDQQRGATEIELHTHAVQDPIGQVVEPSPNQRQVIHVKTSDHEFWNDGNESQIDRACKRDSGQDGLNIFCGFLPGPNSWNKPAVLAHVVGNFRGIKNNGSIKVAEENNSGHVKKIVKRLSPMQGLGHVLEKTAIGKGQSKGLRKGQDRGGKNDGYYAANIDLER